MWTSFINTINGFAKLAREHYKNWAGLIFRGTLILLLLGTGIGMLAMKILYFLPLTVKIEEEDTGIWLNYSLRTGLHVMIIGCGLLAAAFSRHPQTPATFSEFAAKTPRAAWIRFLSFSVFITLPIMMEMYFQYRMNSLYTDGPLSSLLGADDTENMRAFFFWLMTILYNINAFIAPLLAGLLFVKAAGATRARLYSRQIVTVALLGFLMLTTAGSLYYNINIVILDLVWEFLRINWHVPSTLFVIFIVLAAAGVWTWLICGAFYEEEPDFELEKETKAVIHQ
ncbi:hypothetical protein ACFOTA_16725 [Chitinophaga sp. GCM10012297]|uniref:Uncharacterized protein n=1 Tax=Chitinophaga chungangae TaxID=2821488 RepID=A0ABS3YGR6_9BACT|nr:hypothetical protein [Chitinophaga chungangae]MBO9153866.1 hypothetical protein [Chitinophaga chungangae]